MNYGNATGFLVWIWPTTKKISHTAYRGVDKAEVPTMPHTSPVPLFWFDVLFM